MSRLLLILLLALPGCGGQIILGLPDAGPSEGSGQNGSPCATDKDCAGDEPGACVRGQCATQSAEDAGLPTPANGPFPVCPGAKPRTGSSCPTPNQGCAYVDVTEGTCESWTCSDGYVWESSTPAGC